MSRTQENKSDNGSNQPTKSDGIPGNESINGSDGSALFSLYVLINILVNTREEFYTTIICYRIPMVGPNQIRWKILHYGYVVGSLPGFLQKFIGLTEIRIKSDRIPIGFESVWSSSSTGFIPTSGRVAGADSHSPPPSIFSIFLCHPNYRHILLNAVLSSPSRPPSFPLSNHNFHHSFSHVCLFPSHHVPEPP